MRPAVSKGEVKEYRLIPFFRERVENRKETGQQESESSVTLRSSFLLETNPLQPDFLQVTVSLIRLPSLVHSK